MIPLWDEHPTCVLSIGAKKLYRIIVKSYDDLEKTRIIDNLLSEAIEKSKKDKKKILILDVGGYFSEPIMRLSDNDKKYISGIVEDTTYGHNRYIQSVGKVGVPCFSVARSALKEIEARFVGRDAVMAMDMTLRKLGISIAGRNALVLGYGMIGRNVARSLKATDLVVSVYDKYDFKNLQAFIDGFHIHKKMELIKNADIIFSATAECAMKYNDIDECKNNVILASVGSRDSEFDVVSVKDNAIKFESLDDYLVKYEMPNSKNVIIAKDGSAVNFILPSTPNEVLDLVFSEIIECIISILDGGKSINESAVNVMGDEVLSEVAKSWLVPMNQ